MNESYYNNSTENITSSNHCAGLLIGGDEYDSAENNLDDSTNGSIKEAWTTLEPITRTITTTLLRLTKIMTTI